MPSTTTKSTVILTCALALGGCSDGTLGSKPGDTDSSETAGSASTSASGSSSSSASGTNGTSTGPTGGATGPEVEGRAIDLVFVIDNSGSTGRQQRALVDGLDGLLGTLDAAAEPVDYRIAVTTTDVGNPWCTGTTPEAGSLVASSCTERLGDFIFQGSAVDDNRDEACLEVCGLEALGLPDPWIDVSAEGTNLPAGVTVRDAASCLLPQGINGCGFERHLEASATVVRRLQTVSDPAFGFHRPGALLALVLVTDEADCSFAPESESIFLPEGRRAFWTLPEQAAPTSGLCWNAGVQCAGGPGVYLDCTPADYAVDGSVSPDPAQAVLRPVGQYAQDLGAEVGYFAAITGVQPGGSIIYADPTDPTVGNNFGIGYGCSSDGINAVPPVRIRAVAEQLGGDLYSACQADYTVPLGTIAQRMLERLP